MASHLDPEHGSNAPRVRQSSAESNNEAGSSDAPTTSTAPPADAQPAAEASSIEPTVPSQSSSATTSGHASRFSLDGPDRVFPIRSVISVEPSSATSTGSLQSPSGAISSGQDGARAYSIIDADTWHQMRLEPSPSEDTEGGTNSGSQSTATATTLPTTPAPGEGSTPPTMSRAVHGTTGEDISASIAGDKDSYFWTPAGDPPPPPAEAPAQPAAAAEDDSHGPHPVTARFQHVMVEGGHAVITGRGGASFQYCEEEPIHVPGAIQSFGAMIALREESPNQLVVRIASENSKVLLGYSPRELFELNNFCDIFPDDQADSLLDHVDFVKDEACDPSIDGPEVFIISITPPGGRTRRLWCAIHVNNVNKDLIICEFELEEDLVNPLNVSGQTTPRTPADTLGIMPRPEDLAASTMNISQPLRVLRNARRRRGEAAAMEVFNILSQIQEQLSRAQSLDALLNTTTGLVKELTGFHRVLIYQFDSSWNGMVVAELVDPRTTVDLYKGLRFPASDIPKQARDLYKINKVRLLYDRDQPTARLVCRTVEDLETPLDMTHSYLRAMSPIHIKYLANMAVRASMSISINAFNELWGLISCHSYGKSGMRVSFPIRKMCRLIGDTVSRNIERLSYASRLQARKLINTVPTEANPSGYIIASSDDLLKLFDADYGALSIRDETKILGKLGNSQEVLVLVEYLKMRQINSVLASQDVTKDFPDLRYPPGFKQISGMLYVPLSAGGGDFIAFFRKGQLMEIRWAGNPYEKEFKKGTAAYLEPRKSFQTWKETVLHQSREWSETDVETAAVLCLVYGKFIKVWRQKEAAMHSSQLTKLLLANSAHEVRTPLNAIINYLEIALEGALDAETRDNLTKSHSASKSLIYVINDLLDLTNTEKGQSLIKDETFELKTTVHEATDMFDAEAKRKGIGYRVTMHPGLPGAVLGDQRRVRQVIMNLISNAIQHTSQGCVSVEVWRSPVEPDPGMAAVEMTVTDTGTGMTQSTLEALFHDLEQVSTEDESYLYDDEQGDDSLPAIADGGGRQRRTLGLGLALVARIVRNLHGQLSVKSEEGKGSRFTILLQFPVPDNAPSATAPRTPPAQDSTSTPVTPPAKVEGEFVLVDRNMRRRNSLRRRSQESNRSSRSFGSSRSGRSEADRLISAMQEPPIANRSVSQQSDFRRSRTNSPDSMKSNRSNRLNTSIGSLGSIGGGGGGSRERRPSRASSSLVTSPQPTTLSRLGSATPPAPPGHEAVTDSGVLLGALKIREQDAGRSSTAEDRPPQNSICTAGLHSTSSVRSLSTSIASPTAEPHRDPLRVLVAEDDPINSKIVQKRLGKLGHEVHLTANGEQCAAKFREDPSAFDAILMDIQMPIVDGISATKMIRDFEASIFTSTSATAAAAATANDTPSLQLSYKAKPNGRIPIVAVSASLVEKDVQKYIDTGFDAWIMKPIGFHRLGAIFDGVEDPNVRMSLMYQPGMWEKGGWLPRSEKS